MIRIVTLSDDQKGMDSAARLRDLIEQLRLAEIDVICCQGIQRTFDSGQTPVRKIAESLKMTDVFSPTNRRASTPEQGKEVTISGLSILTGSHVWMLNSGSFVLACEDSACKQVAQFAVIRQNGSSVLVINMEFSSVASIQLQQLRAVLSHQFLQKRYSAVVLCGKGQPALALQDMEAVMASSDYKLVSETRAKAFENDDAAMKVPSVHLQRRGRSCDGILFVLSTKQQTSETIQLFGASAALLEVSIRSAEFELKHIPTRYSYNCRNSFLFPLSFSEQWIGGPVGNKGLTASVT
ncbi:MAG: hypothetical protein JZU50_12955 [Desulfobulbaceae bacterium]|nr:hypothetical protein [Desulfobulbaceae bacterium]